MAYGDDFRKRAMSMLVEKKSVIEVSRLLDIGYSTLHRWKKRQEDGKLGARYPSRRKAYKLDEEKLKLYIEKHPDAYAREITVALGSTRGTVASALKRLNITRKKRLRSTGSGMKKNVTPISRR